MSMATFAARRLGESAPNTAGIVAVELLAACPGLDFRSPLLKSSPLLEEAQLLRQRSAVLRQGTYFSPDMKRPKRLVESSAYNVFMPAKLLPSF